MEPTCPGPEDRAPPALAEHLVEEIFVRLGDFADLARASASCKAFCCLITDSTFLRRYRALHPPLLLGFLDPEPPDSFAGLFIPTEAPHPNAPAARSLAGGASDFRFFHLPHPHQQRSWSPCDARNGCVLLASWDDDDPIPFRPPVLAVGDPLTRRNTLVLPPVPGNLLASAPVWNRNAVGCFTDAFFDPSVSYNEALYRVMWWCPGRCAIFIYSSVSNAWTLGASVGADLLEPQDLLLLMTRIPNVVSYVHGCLYRKHYGSDELIKLNINSMELSVIYLPPDYADSPDVVVVEDGEGTIWICHLDHTTRNPRSYFIRQLREDEDENEHAVETPITLPDEYDCYHINSAVDGYIFIQGCRRPLIEKSAFFSLEMKTMKLERILSTNSFRLPCHVVPYFGYPPFISSGRI